MTGVVSPFGLWFFLGWAILAGLVLPQTWKPVRVDDPSGGLRWRIAHRFPRLGRSLPPRLVLGIVAFPVVGSLAYGWLAGDTLVRFGVVVLLATLGLVRLILWLTDF